MAQRLVAPVGALSMLGVGYQPDFTTAVYVKHLAEYRTGAFEGTQEVLYSEANIDSPSPRLKSVVGDFSATGDFTTEVTPQRSFPLLLTGIFGDPSETILSKAAPGTLAATVNGTPATTTYKYYFVSRTTVGNYPSVPSAPLTVTTGAAVITGTNSITLTWAAVTGCTNYDILRGATLATATLIGTVAATTFTDTGSAGTAYAYVTSPVSQKTWVHGWSRNYLSVAQKKGNAVFMFPAVAFSKMDVKVDRGQREVITAQFGAKASNMGTFSDPATSPGGVSAAMAEVGLDTAMYDTLPPFSPAKALVLISDVGGTLVAASHFKEFGLSFDRQTTDEYVLNGKLGPYGFVDSVSGLSVNLSAYFKPGAEYDLKRFMGNASTISSESAYGFQGVIQQVSLECQFPYPSGYGFDSVFSVTIPRAAYGSLGVPIGGRNQPIMQDMRVEPIYDGNSETDLIISIISAESAASITYNNQPVTTWAVGTTYAAGANVNYLGGAIVYQSVVGSNTGNNPSTDNGSNWIQISVTMPANAIQ